MRFKYQQNVKNIISGIMKTIINNKQIKFRSWNAYSKKMSYLYGFTLGIRGSIIPQQNVIVMQSVNHRDKNNIDIFEGDLVKIEGLVELVTKIDGMLCSFNPKTYHTITTVTMQNFREILVDSSDYFEHYEVIGNIFENEDLLI